MSDPLPINNVSQIVLNNNNNNERQTEAAARHLDERTASNHKNADVTM